MSITTTWSINTLERTVADGIVFTVHYHILSTDGTYNSSAYGSVGLDAPAEGDEVIPYADLTVEKCLEWTKDKLGDETVTNVETALANQISEQKTPTKATGTPWS